MPEEAELATPPPEAQYKSWDGTRVPPSVFAALTEKYRGQKGIGTKQVEVLDFFTETARLKGVGQTTMSGGGGGSPPTLTREKNVETVFKLKAAPDSSTSTLVAAYGQINASRMMKHVLLSKDVPDKEKVALCTGRTAADPTKWLQEYRAKQSAPPSDDAGETLHAAEFETLTPAEKNARKRQQVLGERVVMKLTAAQIMAIHYALCTFFFICRVPFVCIEHWAFIAFVRALNPAYVSHMFKRKALSTTWLRKLRADTEEKTEAHMDRTIGRKTIIVDGFKDRCGRHVMNISSAKVGFASYVRTAWFGRKQHSGKTYGDEIKSVVGAGDEYLACCADNTSSNTSMQNGLFGQLDGDFDWFFLGCCVHGMDLLSEDVAKLPEIAAVIVDMTFVTRIVLRFSILTETFKYLQTQRRKHDISASMLSVKNFPDTRFAYAFFTIFAVYVNWSVLQQLLESPEYKLLKRSARPERRALLKRFEGIIGDPSKKAKADAAVQVLRPISSGLHYLEGDDVDASHVLPVYCTLHQNAQSPHADVTDELSGETLKAVADMFEDRWLGKKGGVHGRGAKIGIRHNLHCLAWKLDLHARFTVQYSSSNGPDLLTAIDSSFPSDAVEEAFKTYSAGNETLEAKLLLEYEKFCSKTGPYSIKWRSADLVIKNNMANCLSRISEANKSRAVTRIIELLKNRELLISKTMYKAMAEDEGLSHETRLFCTMAYEVLAVVTQACAVERINKTHGNIHSKARASMGSDTTNDCLYVFTNECLLHKLQAKPAVLGSFETFVAALDLPTDDLEDVLQNMQHVNISDYLPAESADAPAPSAPKRRPRSRGDDDDDDDDNDDEPEEEEEEEEEEDDDDEEEDDGYVYLPDADVPPGFKSVVVSDPVAFIPADALDNHAIMLCCDDSEWMLGKIVKYKPRAKKFQFDVEWAPGTIRQQHVELEKYFLHDSGEPPEPGNWFYLTWARSSTGATEPRRRGRDDGDETVEMETEEKERDEDDEGQGDGNESEA